MRTGLKRNRNCACVEGEWQLSAFAQEADAT